MNKKTILTITLIVIALITFRKPLLKKWYISQLKDIYAISKSLEQRLADDNPLNNPSPKEWEQVHQWEKQIKSKLAKIN